MLIFRRTVSLMLALVMLAGMIPVHTYAEELSGEEEVVSETVVMETTEPVPETTAPAETQTEPVTEPLPETESAVTEEPTVPATEGTEEVTLPETEEPETTEETEPVQTEETIPQVSMEAAMASSGTCGTSVNWTLSDAGVLTISGSGAMTDWNAPSYVPWYSEKDNITTVVIEDGVTTIGDAAFFECSALTAVTIGSDVYNIGYRAFRGCSKLSKVTIPDSVTTIEDSAFYGCTSLKAMYIPANVVSIPATSVAESPFYGCYSGLNLFCEVASKGGSWGKYWCYYKENYSLKVSWSVPDAQRDFWTGDAQQAEVVIPDSITEIPSNAFQGNTTLTSITIPATVTSIGTGAFDSCSNLALVNISDLGAWCGITFGDWFSNPIYYAKVLRLNGKILQDMVIPDGVTAISKYAFYYCSSLTSVTIPDSVITIDQYAFGRCSGMSEVTVGSGVTSIGIYAFENCSGLSQITFKGDAPAFSNYCFNSVTAEARYPAWKASWTSDVMQDYGGTITWVDICADGHTTVTIPGTSATCTEDGLSEGKYCSACGKVFATQSVITAPGHTIVTDAAVAATCTEDGLTEGSHCSGCGLVVIEQETIPAAGHLVVTDPAVEPSCTNTGLTAGSHCANCGTILVKQNFLDYAHELVTIDAVAPTCTQNGLTEGTLCNLCGEILTAQEVVPAAHTVVTDSAVEVTCSKPGLTEGSHCSACGEVFTAQQEIPAPGHSFTDGTCTACGAATGSCGTGLVWLLEDGILTISGSGAMDGYSLGGAPWYGSRTSVTSLVIEADVTAIGTYAFAFCNNLKTITFLGDQPSIGSNAFYKVTAEVTFSGVWSADSLQNYGGTLTWIDPCGGSHTVVTQSAVAATCTESGLTEECHCSACGMILQVQTVVEALGHDLGDWNTVTAATCTASGQKTRSCSRCDHSETQTIAASGHDYESTVTVPGCESQGFTTHTCLNCGDSYVNGYTDPLGHDLSVRTTVQAATCTENGQEKQQCSRCSHSELAVLEATGHSYQSVVTAAGCETTGYTTHTCSNCGNSYKNTYTSALGHDLGAWVTVTAATCTASGSQRRTCSRCDHYETQSIAATGHSMQTLPAVAATCTSTGLTEGTGCISCGLVTEAQETVPVLGHDMSSWTIASAATCTQEGVRRRDCTRCDHYETQTIAATDHSRRTLAAVEATCTTSGLTEGADCSICGAVLTAQQAVAALGHAYGDWATITAATCTASGQQRRDCGRCDHYETRIVQATGHREQIVPGVAATCTASGLTEGIVCSVCDTVLTAQKTIAARGHTEQILPAVAATCTESGLTEGKVCSVCHTVLTAQQTVAAPGHTVQILPAVAAACTESGLTEGKTCSVCQEVLLAQEIVEATGHDYVNCICQDCGHYATGNGSLGLDVTWDVDTQTGQLTFSGSGSLEIPEELPWAGYEDAILQILIGEGVTEIAGGLLEGLAKLETVILPESITFIDPDLFSGCGSLTDIQVSDGNPVYKDIDGILFSKDGTELVNYPGGREDASYTVPGSVTRVGANAFSACGNLHTLYFTSVMPEFGDDALTGLTATVYYPGGDPTWDPEKLLDYGGSITWVPQYDQPEVMSITSDRQALRLGEQAVLTAQLNMQATVPILWEVTAGSDYVQLNAGGTTAQLTAKAVTKKTTVTITARTANGVAKPAEINIDILPQVQSMSVVMEDGTAVTGNTFWWDLNSGVTEMTFTAEVYPAGASETVTWSFSDPSRLYAEYTASGNALTVSSPTGKTGTVYITVTAADGSGQSAKFAVKFTALQTETDAPESEDPADIRLLSGKTRNLTVYDADTGKPLTSKQITWTMDEVYAPYAKIDAKGKLTAKKVVEKVRVEAVGTIVGSEGTTVTVTADIYPAAAALELLREDTLVNNQTISLDHTAEPLVLTAGIHPLDAMQDVTWTINDKKEAFASYEIDGSVLTVTPKVGAKPGTVTIKATSNDGSKKTATAKLQFSSYAQTVTIDKSIAELTAGDKAVQLYATMTPSVVTKSGIVWSLKNAVDKNYVNLSSGGKIAPKNVSAPVDVVIVATSKDGMASDEHTITIRPKSESQLVIKSGDVYVTKTTQVLDVNIRESITLSAHTYGQENLTMVEWSPLTSKGADITANTDGTLTVRMTSPGSINITAKAEDGRKATVAIKGVKLASSLEISQKKTGITEGLELASGKSLDLQATLTNAASKKVTWSITEGGAFATLASSGKLTAAKDLTSAKTVVVRATAEGGAYDEMEIILRPAARGVQIYSEAGGRMLFSFRSQNWWVRSNTTLVWDSATQSNTISLNARIYPYYGEDDAKNAAQAVTWQSSTPKVAQIEVDSDGNVQLVCKGTGSTTITATAADGSKEKVSFKLTVVKSITRVSLEDQSLSCGKKLDLSKLVTITPANATSKKLTWQLLEGAEYASLSNAGVLTAKKDAAGGKVRVRVTPAENAVDGVYAECTVNIFAAATRVAIFDGDYDATGQQGSITIKTGEDTALCFLRAVVYPYTDDGNDANDAGQKVIWKSSNTAYAEVKDGMVILKRAGIGKTVTITATATDGSGKKATVKLRIVAE